MSFSLRPFRPDDAPLLLDLFRDTVRRINRRDYSPDQIAAWASDDIDSTAWAARFAGRLVWIAQIDARIAGFADLEPNGHLDRFFVSADHQRQGIGSALLVALLDTARQRGMARIHVDASITARPFFEAHGFVVTAPQRVTLRGVEFLNFRMERSLD